MTTIPENPTRAEAMAIRLGIRYLVITPDEIQEALTLLDAHGIKGVEAETILFHFLERLSPYGERRAGRPISEDPVRFMGWDTLATAFSLVLDGLPMQLRDEVLHRRWGTDAVRVALVIYTHGKATS